MSSKLERLWAPWRLSYIEDNHKKGKTKSSKTACPFCEASKAEASLENLVLFKDKDYFVVMNKFPYNPYHLMVIPHVHVGELLELDPQIWLRMNAAVQGCVKLLRDAVKPQGFNLGMNLGAAAGAGIADHLHIHILPRWAGDTNFMPLIAETKALPTHNETVYKKLQPLFKNFKKKL
jgi:ATP adenylyltransferase